MVRQSDLKKEISLSYNVVSLKTFSNRHSTIKGLSLRVAHFTHGENSPLSDVNVSFAGRYDLESAGGPDDGASKRDQGKPSHFLQTLYKYTRSEYYVQKLLKSSSKINFF